MARESIVALPAPSFEEELGAQVCPWPPVMNVVPDFACAQPAGTSQHVFHYDEDTFNDFWAWSRHLDMEPFRPQPITTSPSCQAGQHC